MDFAVLFLLGLPLAEVQPTGERHEFVGRLPKTLVLDLREGDVEVLHVYEGETAGDRADPDDLLAVIDDVRASFAFDCSLVER